MVEFDSAVYALVGQWWEARFRSLSLHSGTGSFVPGVVV